MKTLCLSIIVILALVSVSFAGSWEYNDNKRPYKDAWGNSYKHQDNLWKDTDKDGVINYYDYNDRNRNIQNPYQQKYEDIYNPYKPKKSYKRY